MDAQLAVSATRSFRSTAVTGVPRRNGVSRNWQHRHRHTLWLYVVVGMALTSCSTASESSTQNVPVTSESPTSKRRQLSGTLDDWVGSVCTHVIDRHVLLPSATTSGECAGRAQAFGVYSQDSENAMLDDLSLRGPYALGDFGTDRVVFVAGPGENRAVLAPLESYGFTLHPGMLSACGVECPERRPPISVPSVSMQPSSDPGSSGESGATLLPNNAGYVAIRTTSGRTTCMIERERVVCEASQTDWPAHGVEITADGSVRFADGNLGDMHPTHLKYQTYRAIGWTVVASTSGTQFTNDRTRHGAFVSVQTVQAF